MTEIPRGTTTVKVAILNSAFLNGIPMSRFAKPTILGQEKLKKAPSFSYLVEHPCGRRILFDLGVRRDLVNLSPIMCKRMKDAGWEASVERSIPDLLEEQMVSLQSIDTVIWRYGNSIAWVMR